MKKLLIRLALWILRKWSVDPVCVDAVCVDIGTTLCFRDRFYEIQDVTQTFEYAFESTLKIKAQERILMEVNVE